MKLGARIFKTGLAVMLSLYLAVWIGFEPPTFAALAATLAVQPSIHRTFQTILEQIQANVIGALLSVLFVMTFGNDPFVVGLVVVLTIAIILRMKLEPSTVSIALVTVIVIMESPSEHFIEFAASRFGLILIGVFAAFIVNLAFIPPRYETKLYYKVVKAVEDINQWTMLFIRQDAQTRALKKDLTRLEEVMVKLDNLYLLYKEERTYFLKNNYSKARKIVLFRQMLVTTKKALFVLKNLDRRSDELTQLSDDTYNIFVKQLDYLTTYHDLILLRYIGKVHSNRSDEMINELNQGKEALMNAYIELRDSHSLEPNLWMNLLPAVSQMVEYQEQLEHLDHLVDSFFTFHTDENEVKVRVEDEA